MLCFLLDEQISPVIAEQLRRKYSGISVTTLHNWHEGRYLGTSDETFITEAVRERLTLVSYDLRTIPPLLKVWIEAGIDHGGVVFVNAGTIPPQDFGGLVKSLGTLWQRQRRANWKNRVVFLTRS